MTFKIHASGGKSLLFFEGLLRKVNSWFSLTFVEVAMTDKIVLANLINQSILKRGNRFETAKTSI